MEPLALSQTYLSLHLVRLQPHEEWTHKGEGGVFIFPQGGDGRYVSEDLVQPVEPGDVFFVSGWRGKLCAGANVGMIFRYFDILIENLMPLFSCSEICQIQDIIGNSIRLHPATSDLAIECHRLLGAIPSQLDLDHRGQLLRIASSILAVEFKRPKSHRSGFIRIEDHITQVFEKLTVAEILGLSVGELANKFSCSRRHLSRLFHQHFGVSVATLRMEMRLLKAVTLLRNPDIKIINVAEQCGFNHLSLFNTCFKKRFGVSPGRWRTSHLETTPQVMAAPKNDAPCRMKAIGMCPWSARTTSSAVAPAISKGDSAVAAGPF